MLAINLGATVELVGVILASAPVPARAGVVAGPSFGGYRPEAMFRDLIARVVEKLEQEQAVGAVSDAVPVPVVELSQSELTSELRSDLYRARFAELINNGISDLRGYGAVAFCETADSGTRLLSSAR